MEDELDIDVRQYIDVLVRRWRLIGVLLLLAVLAAVAVVLLSPPSPYEAVAGVVIVKTKTDVEFDARFKTVSDEADSTQASEARRNALVGLVANGAIAGQVIAELGDQLSPDEHNPAVLLGKVSGELLPKGDLIQIKVVDQDPHQAAAMADAWAREYERYVNDLYGGAPIDYSASVQSEFERARQAYEVAQADLEAFIADNQVDVLTRLIDEKRRTVDALQYGKQVAISTVVSQEIESRSQVVKAYVDAQLANKLLVFQKEQQGWRELLSAYADAQNNARLAVFNEQSQARLQTLAGYYDARLRIDRLIEDAESMREQVRLGGDAAAASNGLALLLLKAQAFSLSAPLPGQLQVQVGTPAELAGSAAAQLADLDSLIAALQVRRQELEAAIAESSQQLLEGSGYSFITTSLPLSSALSEAMAGQYARLFAVGELASLGEGVPGDNPLALAVVDKSRQLLQLEQVEPLVAYVAAAQPLSQAMDDLQKDIRGLEAQLEAERATKQKLVQARDLAWETYTTLARKQAELSIASAATGSEVRYAAPPVVPDRRVPGGRLTRVALAAALGLFLGILAAFGVEYLGGGANPQALFGKPGWFWNRAFRWVMREGAGLPSWAVPRQGGQLDGGGG